MMMGSSFVRTAPRHWRARATPLWPGSIQSSTTRSGSTRSTSYWACVALPASVTSKPAWRRLMEISSAIADSSSTTRIRLIPDSYSADHGLDGLRRVVPDVLTLDHIDDHFREVLGVVTHALDGLRNEDQIDGRGDRARVFHHVGDELAQQAVEFLVDLVVVFEHIQGALHVQTREGVQGLAQLAGGQLGLVGEVRHRHAQPAGHATCHEALHRACDPRRLVADALEIGDALRDRNQQAQVAGGRLTARDDGREIVIDLDFHRVHAAFPSQDLVG
mmetsp:Transcript_53283/g.124988  ORF Transcript_53283/g.124988 Transcript_53283/m.124988 type:complete len:275 (-) Transcript_53283:4962-5786(-)